MVGRLIVTLAVLGHSGLFIDAKHAVAGVRVEIREDVPVSRTWDIPEAQPGEWSPVFDSRYFAMKTLPRKYNQKGLIVDRAVPLLLRLSCRVALPAGEYEFRIRSLDACRLLIDGKLIGETPFMSLISDSHQPYYEGLDRGPHELSMAPGHSETIVHATLDGQEHDIELVRWMGHKKHGAHLGEMVVGFRRDGGPLRILGPQSTLPFTDAGWLDFLDWEHVHLTRMNQRLRREAGRERHEYWRKRHAFAKRVLPPARPIPDVDRSDVPTNIDRFIAAKWEDDVEPQPLVDDLTFLRRVALDTTGRIPTEELRRTFLQWPVETRREQAIERLLDDPSWADHWVGYWQDVLAENPGLTKPELNNTGPFRWFVHESFQDNKPLDRFVTELIRMEGSRYAGGPAGFGLASQNDVPLAAKAHILATAFLGVEMKCARCHDAPFHTSKQRDLFGLAAMLQRTPLKVPGSSSIQVSDEELAKLTVRVSLSPGSAVAPTWPFSDWSSLDPNERTNPGGWPDWVFDDVTDSREILAAEMTSPYLDRFARVLVNRIWKRYLGRGLVEPVHDWEGGTCSHPQLLDWLAGELVTSGYDLKHVVRLILLSSLYQRAVDPRATSAPSSAAPFIGPVRRMMSGEQLVDSLFLAVGKPLDVEELTMDPDGKRPPHRFGHFGDPRRAWEFTAVSNERDRPSLNLPAAQSLIDLLAAYGWRQQRQEPRTLDVADMTPLQSLVLANGTAANRAVDLSDRGAITQLCLDDQPVTQLVSRIYRRVLTRDPTPEESSMFVELLRDGYEGRVVAGPEAVTPRRIDRTGVTWTNHFDPRSDEAILRRQRLVSAGDRPTNRLDSDWRARVEDMLWALVNSPEFVFLP